jgi:ATP-binding cassette subfamily F protein 3
MDKLVTHTMGIHRTKIRKIAGNTEKFYTQIALDEEIYEKTRLNDERRQKDVEQFIRRFRAKARLANLVQSRIKLLEKMGKKDKLERLKSLEFSFRSKPLQGKYAMKVQDLSFAYNPEIPLITHLTITIKPHERVCVVGKNGKGKTTLLKLLSGTLTPTGGNVTCSPTITKGFFEQTNVTSLVENRTVVDEIGFSHSDVDKQTAWNICGAMMFEGEHALKKISVLSGGEKSRVMLGKLLATPLNLLLLDEITNHLDMESCDALLAALDNFEGAVIMVTHNEMFLHALAERLIVFQKDRLYLFEGSYQRFLEKDGWEDEDDVRTTQHTETRLKEESDKRSKKEKRRSRAKIIAERSKVLKPLEQQIRQAEHAIESHENHLKNLTHEMEKASQVKSSTKIAAISQAIHNCRSDIDKLFDELERLITIFETYDSKFNNKLNES